MNLFPGQEMTAQFWPLILNSQSTTAQPP